MDGLSATASIIAVVQITQAVGKALRDFYRDARDARSQIEQLYDSVVSLGATVKELNDLVARKDPDMINVALLEDPEGPLKKALKELQSINAALDIEVVSGSRFEKIKLSVRKEVRRSIGWPFKKVDVTAMVERLESNRKILMTNVNVNILSVQFIQYDILRDIKSEVEVAKANSHRMELIKWLSNLVPDPSIEHNIAVKKHEKTTGSWLVKGHDLERWRTSPNSYLWVQGNAGAGKSILCSTVIDHIQESCRNEPSSVVAYWYFSFRSPESQKVDNLLRSLVINLCSKLRDIPEALQTAYEKANNGLLSPSTKTLLEILEATLEQFQHTYIILDALDECPRTGTDQESGGHRERDELLERIHEICSWNQDCLHFFATSRKEGDIEESMNHLAISQHNFKSISVQGARVEKDIRKYIHRKLKSNRFSRWTSEFKAEVESKLASQADGMFRLVALQLDMLLSSSINSIAAIRRVLNELPRSLDALYDWTLTQIPEEDRPFAALALKWIAYTVRPLSIREISEAVIIRSGKSPCLEEDDRFIDEDRIVHMLPAALVRTRKISLDKYGYESDSRSHWEKENRQGISIVEFPHFSVFEYLRSTRMSSNLRPVYQLEEAKGQRLIAESCLSYILQIGSNKSGLVDKALNLLEFAGWTETTKFQHEDLCDELDRRYPLAAYSYRLWHFHLVSAHYSEDEELKRLTLEFLDFEGASWRIWLGTSFIDDIRDASRLKRGYSTFERYKGESELTIGPSALRLHPMTWISWLGLLPLFDLLHQRYPNLSNVCTTPSFGTPLHAASHGGHLDIVQALLAHSADANALGGSYGSALLAAIEGKNCTLDLVKLLVQSGAEVNTIAPEMGVHETAFICAASHGRLDICQFLIESGSDVKIITSKEVDGAMTECNALQVAASGYNVEIAKLILSSGAGINQRLKRNQTPWLHACLFGSSAVVELFLQSGADPNADFPGPESGQHLTPLHAAVTGIPKLEEAEMKTTLLLQAGADINKKVDDEQYPTVLHATMDGQIPQPRLVKMLLDAGAGAELGPKDDPKGPYQFALNRYEQVGGKNAFFADQWLELHQVFDEYYAKISALETS